MSAKLKLTKDSLSKEKKALARFSRFLPTLQLRKTQLFNEIHRIRQEIADLESERRQLDDDVQRWVGVFGEEVDIDRFLKLEQVVVDEGNVAGIDIPIFKEARFKQVDYDLMAEPFWLDAGLQAVKRTLELKLQLEILNRQVQVVQAELTTTVQRINLFEKVKIPQTKDNIRKIRIFLGDQQTAAVVRGKMTKAKLIRKRESGSTRMRVEGGGRR